MAVAAPPIEITCEHSHRLSLEERWTAAEKSEREIAVCRCCSGPCLASFVTFADGSRLGINTLCRQCTEAV